MYHPVYYSINVLTRVYTIFAGLCSKVPPFNSYYSSSTQHPNKNFNWKYEFDGCYLCGTYWNYVQGFGTNGWKVNIFFGYGALLDEYEILSIEANVMKLRIQGTETGNAWYLTLVPKS